jgi:CBS domain-containing protein
MRARDIMTAKPLTVVPTDPVWKAAEIMRYEDIGGVPVVSDKATGKLVGLITDRDITVRCIARRHGAVCVVLAHMTPQPLYTVHPDADVSEIVEKMEAAEVRRIPVVDDRGILVGIVAERDLAMKLAASEALPLRKRIKAASRRALATVEVAIR